VLEVLIWTSNSLFWCDEHAILNARYFGTSSAPARPISHHLHSFGTFSFYFVRSCPWRRCRFIALRYVSYVTSELFRIAKVPFRHRKCRIPNVEIVFLRFNTNRYKLLLISTPTYIAYMCQCRVMCFSNSSLWKQWVSRTRFKAVLSVTARTVYGRRGRGDYHGSTAFSRYSFNGDRCLKRLMSLISMHAILFRGNSNFGRVSCAAIQNITVVVE